MQRESVIEACPGAYSFVNKQYKNDEIVFEHENDAFCGITRIGLTSKGCGYRVLPENWGSWCNPTRSISSSYPTMAILTQGFFRKPIPFQDLQCGVQAREPFNHAALPWRPIVHTAVAAARHFLVPSLELDLFCECPFIHASVLSTADVLNISLRGSEPSIFGPCEEDVSEWNCRFKGMQVGERVLLKGNFVTSPNHMYTIGMCTAALDLTQGAVRTPVIGDVDIKPVTGAQKLIPFLKTKHTFITAFEML